MFWRLNNIHNVQNTLDLIIFKFNTFSYDTLIYMITNQVFSPHITSFTHNMKVQEVRIEKTKVKVFCGFITWISSWIVCCCQDKPKHFHFFYRFVVSSHTLLTHLFCLFFVYIVTTIFKKVFFKYFKVFTFYIFRCFFVVWLFHAINKSVSCSSQIV